MRPTCLKKAAIETRNLRRIQKKLFIQPISEFGKNLCKISKELTDACNRHLSLMEDSKRQILDNDNIVTQHLIGHDPADRHDNILTTGQKLYLIEQGPFQPMMLSFPKNSTIPKGKQNSFSSKWYKEFPLIEYSLKLQNAFSFACSLFGDGVGCSKAESSWSKDGTNAWEKMRSRGTKKPGKLLGHFRSEAHLACVEKMDNLRVTERQIDFSLSKANRDRLVQEEKDRLENRRVIALLLDVCKHLGREALAFRGRGDDSQGNYQQTVALLSRWVPFLNEWIYSTIMRKYKVAYLSKTSQNDFIDLLASTARDDICEKIKNVSSFSVMANTTPDVSHKDQMSLIIRYVTEDFEVLERLLNITTLSEETGDGSARMVIKCINELNLPTSGVRFQCYDTTASMSGIYKGAQAKLSEHLQRKIPYIPCLEHKSNLCVEHACSESRLADDFFLHCNNCTTS